MARNVEIKARARDWQALCSKAEALADRGPEHLKQEDVFFQVPEGRLKLRIFNPENAELISYQRPNQAGPKCSQYERAPIHEPLQFKKTLAAALPIIGTVVKQRTVFFKGRTRIHLDTVEGLGHFLELEVVLHPNEPFEYGKQEADVMINLLGIQPGDLMETAYIDLLMQFQSGSIF